MTIDSDLFRDSRWLITGGAGFLAANLVRSKFLDQAEVHLTVRKPHSWRLAGLADRSRLHVVDLRERSELAALFGRLRPDFVVHAATWRSHPETDRHSAVLSNVVGASNLIDAAIAHPPRRLIHLGSSLEYGHRDVVLHEHFELRPSSLHGASKAAASLLVRQASWADRLPAAILRLFYLYGPWERPERLIPTAIRAIQHDQPVQLTEPGLVHDFLYVDDGVGAILAAAVADLAPGEVTNIASGHMISNEDMVKTIGATMGKQPLIKLHSYPTRPIDSRHWAADITQASTLLGWRPTTPLRDGLARTVDWVLQHDER